MRPLQVCLLLAAVTVGVIIGISINGGSRHDHGGGATTATTPGNGAVAEFVRLSDDRVRALEVWPQALSTPFATFLPVSTKVASEEQHIKEQAQAAAGTCESVDEDPCRLLNMLAELADREWFRLGIVERAKRFGRRTEAHAAFTALRSDNCDYAGKVIDLLDRPTSSVSLSHHLPALRKQAYSITLAACDRTRSSDQALFRTARAARVRPADWPPSILRIDPPDQEWRIYAAAVGRSTVIVEKVLAELQRNLEAVRDGSMPPEVFADLAGPDPIAAQAQVDLDAPESLKKDTTLIGRLAEADHAVAELGPPADPSVRRAWHAYRDALESYELAVQRAAGGALQPMRSALARGNSRAAPSLAAFSSHR
jgi:hypothetical protein